MHRLGLDLVWALDLSKSMARAHGELRPSKLDAAREAIALGSSRILDKPGGRAALVGFHDRAFPLLPPTQNYKSLLETLSMLKAVGEGSAAGDGVVEAVKLVRRSGREKRVVVVSDGGFNAGIPLPLAAIYARNSGVSIHFIIVGDPPGEGLKRLLDEATESTGGSWTHVGRAEDLARAVREVLPPEAKTL